MRTAYRVLAVLVSVVTTFQVAVVTLAFFGLLAAVDDGDRVTKHAVEQAEVTGGVGLRLHTIGADVLALVALALLVVAFFARIEGGVTWAAITFGLVVVQFGLAYAASAFWPLGILHGLNALAILVAGGLAARVARASARATATT